MFPLRAILTFTCVAGTAVAGENCAPQCAPQTCAPPCYTCPPKGDEEDADDEEGFYQRGPETGEFAGETDSTGIRGLSIRFPELKIELPEIRLPHRIKYRRNPEMIADQARAPWVLGQPLPFKQVLGEESGDDDPKPGEESDDDPGCTPIPPVPVGQASPRERRLAEELARKEAEIQEMNQRFSQLERMVTKLAERELAQQERAGREVAVEEPEILPSAYERPAPAARPTNAARSAPQAVRQEVPVRAMRRTTVSARSTAAEGGFGDWNQAPAPVESAEPSVLGVELRSPFE
jgi:hypothetical protein